MALLVQKFGGSSLATLKHIQQVAEKVSQARQAGHQVVVVVSAMGDETDQLIQLAQQASDQPNPRELDMLLSCGEQKSMVLLALVLQQQKHQVRSLTGLQAGIHTNQVYNHARIVDIDTDRIKHYLAKDQLVIIAGFQGAYQQEITTLGRGGSDLTAVALAAALQADECQIYTDVDGVYCADPSIIPHAKKLEYVNFDEMIALAGLGAKVLHHRAVLLAKKMQVPLRVLSSFVLGEGTKIAAQDAKLSPSTSFSRSTTATITGIAHQAEQVLVDLSYSVNALVRETNDNSNLNTIKSTSVNGLPQLTQLLARYHLTVEHFAVTQEDQCESVQACMIIPEGLVTAVKQSIEQLLYNHPAFSLVKLSEQADLVRITLVGNHLQGDPQIANTFYQITEQHEAKVRYTFESERTFGALLETKCYKKIIKNLYSAFQLKAVTSGEKII